MPPATRFHRAASEDPAGDKERSGEYEPEVYVINVELHRMIAEADQAAGIIMEAADEEKRRRSRALNPSNMRT